LNAPTLRLIDFHSVLGTKSHPSDSGTMAHKTHVSIPHWSWIAPATGALVVVLAFTGVVAGGSSIVSAVAALLLGAAVFASVHHAEVLAIRVGEPFGSIILAVAVTVIEVGLIVSIMLSDASGTAVVARDTVFSAIMIVLNGVIGVCLVLGAGRHHEQTFRLDSASAALAVLGTLAILTLVLPNYVDPGGQREFTRVQLVVIDIVCLALYLVFVFVQTVRHRDYFLEFANGADADEPPPSDAVTLASAVLLPLSLTAVILLSKLLSYPLEKAVQAAGMPQAVVGVVIAAVVLLPEGIASVRAALTNRLQSSVNLVLGSALASIGLTIPVVADLAVLMDRELTLGLSNKNIVLLLLTLFVSTLTLGTGRTTVLQGAVHLAIFAVFLLLTATP
jgi:Ca2+:H+ antiporter